MKRHTILFLAMLAVVAATVISCTSSDPYVNRGRVGGAAVGGVAGAIIGNKTGMGSWGGAAVGAALGGIMGDTAGKTNSMYYNGRYR